MIVKALAGRSRFVCRTAAEFVEYPNANFALDKAISFDHNNDY
jgi:hypothetical protein